MSDNTACDTKMVKEHSEMLLKHDTSLYGINGDPGVVKKLNILYEWFLTSRGKNSVIMFVKDLLLSGGIIAVIITWILNQ
jgi:hypothetical protein